VASLALFPCARPILQPPPRPPRHTPTRQLEEDALARTRLLDASSSQLAAAEAAAASGRAESEAAKREAEQARRAAQHQVQLAGEEAAALRRQVGAWFWLVGSGWLVG